MGSWWGSSICPGIRRETPPAGASTEPLYGRDEDHQAQAVLRHTYGQGRPEMGKEGTCRKGKKRGKTAAQRLSATYNCTATSLLIPSCGVYDGWRQPLPLFTALVLLTLAKTALRLLIPAWSAFFWPRAAFVSLYRFYTDTRSKICLRRGLCRFWLQIPCTNVYYSSPVI
jgi:hypothetical protein